MKGQSLSLVANEVFDTDFEKGCRVITTPDEVGYFTAFDSEGIECGFNVVMVKCIRCIDCGYTTTRFHGWTFVDGPCFTPGRPSMLHHWEEV